MKQRDPDPSSASTTQPPVVTPPPENAGLPSSRNPLGDRPGTVPESVIVPAPTPWSLRAAVIVPPPSFGSERLDPRPTSPFSLRKVVLPTPRADPPAGDDDVAAGHPAPSSPRRAAPTASGSSGEAYTSSDSTNEGALTDERRAAISNGLRWTMIGRPVIESANLFGAAVLARLVAPAEFGRYAIALIVLVSGKRPDPGGSVHDRAARSD